MRLKPLLGSLMAGLLLISSFSHAEKIFLTSLGWPPYSGKELAEGGASVAVAKAAFKAMGHELVVDFYPWSRAVSLASSESKYLGYFPEYYYDSEEFLFSNAMGTGPLGFVENVSNIINWESLTDLKPYRIGTVQDYVNTEALDSMISSGELKAFTVVSDELNVLKVANNRIELAVIDSNVLTYLSANDERVIKVKDKVQMNAKLLIEKELFVAFRNTSDGRKWTEIFNEGLKKIDVEAIMSEHM